MDKVIFSAQVKKMTSRVDKTWDLGLNTQELSPEETGVLTGFLQQQVFVMLTATPIDDKEATGFKPPADFPAIKQETPSQRLRAVLYRQWENRDTKVDSETWYRNRMEQIIEAEKELIDV